MESVPDSGLLWIEPGKDSYNIFHVICRNSIAVAGEGRPEIGR